MPISKQRATEMFDHDLSIVMDDIRGMLGHYQLADWEAYILIRKPDHPDSYILKYEATAGDSFAQRIVELHRRDKES